MESQSGGGFQPPRRLLSERTCEAVRDLMSWTSLREIDQMWQDERFPPAEDPEPVGGQRVTRFQGYLNQVDWTDTGQVTRALRVFEVVLRPFMTADGFTPNPETIARLKRLFGRDGYTLSDEGTISGGPVAIIAEGLLSDVSDPDVLREHVERIAAAIERDDPALAIGSAKELIESTAKVVLNARSVGYTDADDLPSLVSKAQRALSVHPATRSVGPDSSDAVKKVLGATVTVTTGVAELRNRGYGTGHGPGGARSGLGSRHARLAINAARLWCEFMLDTLSDPKAPWRSAP